MMHATLSAEESARLDAAAARLGVSADAVAAAAAVDFLAGRIAPRRRRGGARRPRVQRRRAEGVA